MKKPMDKLTPLVNFPKHAFDNNFFLFRKRKNGDYVPLKPFTHYLAVRSAPITFYVGHEGEQYNITMDELKRYGKDTKGRML